MVSESKSKGRFRQYKGPLRWFVKVLCISLPAYTIIYLLGFFDGQYFGLMVMPVQHRAISFSVLLLLTFLLVPSTKNEPRDKLPWFDVLLLPIALAGPLYWVIFYESIFVQSGTATIIQQVLCITTILCIIEACRRLLGWLIPGLGIFFLLHVLFGYLLPKPFGAPHYDLSRLAAHIYLWPEGIFGVATHIAATIIISFFIFAEFLSETGAIRFFMDLALSLTGSMRGGPAKVGVVASALMGTLSGAAMANAAATGAITIPMMKKSGFKPEFAAAVEAVASTGGQLMPPVMGATAFLMAEFLEVPYVKICLYALVPAILYFLAVFVIVHLEAVKTGIRGLPPNEIPSLKKTLRTGWHNLLALVALIIFMGVLYYRPEKSVLYSLGVLILVNLFKKETRVGPRSLASALERSSISMLEVGAICGLAGIIIASVHTTGIVLKLAGGLVALSGGHLIVLLILAAMVCYIMGMGMPTMASYILLSILLAPALIALGVMPVAAHMFIFYWAMTSMITPPIAYAVLVTSGIAQSNMMKTGLQSMRLGIIVLLLPFMFVYNPALLAQGPLQAVLLAAVTALIGTTGLAFALMRYIFSPLNWIQTILAGAGAVALIFPGLITDIIGFGALGMVLLWNLMSSRKRAHPTNP